MRRAAVAAVVKVAVGAGPSPWPLAVAAVRLGGGAVAAVPAVVWM